MRSEYASLHQFWFAEKLFDHVDKNKILLTDSQLNQYHRYFMESLQSESDSRNFYKEIILKLPVSNELSHFLRGWSIEEQNHAKGFYVILNLLFGENEAQLRPLIESRVADYRHLDDFFKDEFKLCVLFAYDEYVTAVDYKKQTVYSQLGPKEFLVWIDRLIKDEARHFVNLVKLIRYKYPSRIRETEKILEQVLMIEKDIKDYHFTFVFDHADTKFSLSYDELEKECAERVLKSICR